MSAIIRLRTASPTPIRLAQQRCAACDTPGVSIVAMQHVGGANSVAAWCGPGCAIPAGWPFLTSEIPGEAEQRRLEL